MTYKIINLLINVLITLLLLGIGYLIFQNFDSIKNFTFNKIYYPVINPKAGAAAYEKEYQFNWENADKARIKTSRVISQFQQAILELEDQRVSDIKRGYEIKTTDLMNEREQYLQNLIDIDNKALRLALPEKYKEFYRKRIRADVNEYDAFKDYRMGIETLSKGMILYEFDDKFAPVMDYLVYSDKLSTESADIIQLNLTGYKSYYSANIEPLIASKFFTQDLADSLAMKMHTLEVISKFQIARLQEKDDEETRKYYQEIEKISRMESTKSSVEMFLDWSREKVQPYYYSQDKKHKESFTLFNEAYRYAKTNNLTEIINIWKGKYPGSAEYSPEDPSNDT